MHSEFHRIKRLPPYIFEEVNRLKAHARAAGEDIIDFGMGNPDMPTPKHIVDKLCEMARDPKSNRYSASRGIKGLRKAMAAYYQRRFGVTLDPDSEVIAALGSKEGFANLAAAITAPGDVVLVPNPAYPDPRLRLHPGGRRHPPYSGDLARGLSERDRPRRAPFGAVAAGLGGELSLQSDGAGGGPRFLQGGHRLREEARDVGAVGPRLCRHLFRRQAAAVDPAGRGRQGHRHRIPVPVEDLRHAGLAHGLRRRQQAADRRADAHQILSRLRRLSRRSRSRPRRR